jgi:hypothetical protein
MQLTRRQFLDDFLDLVREPHDPDARATASSLLNLAMTAIWLEKPWRQFVSPVPFRVTLTPGQVRYSLPDYFGRLGRGSVTNLTRGGILHPLGEGKLTEFYPQLGTPLQMNGTPERFEIAGTSGVHTQPATTGDALEAVSDSVADTDVVVALAGEDTNGRWLRNQVTLNGTTAVALGTWAFVDDAGKAIADANDALAGRASSRGTITIRKVTDRTELQKLFPTESSKEHNILAVYPPPDAADTLAFPVIRKPRSYVNEADTLPDLWQPALVEFMQLEWQVNSGELTREAAARAFKPALQALIAFENQTQPRSIKHPFGV